jgi:hypothetical protein
MMLLLIVVVALATVLVGDDDEKAWKLTSCETQNLTHSLSRTRNPTTILIFLYRKQTIDRWNFNFQQRRETQIQDLKLWSQLSPRDQVLAMIKGHHSIGNVRISLSIQYLYSLKEGD